MTKVFISQPMNGLTDSQIKQERQRIIKSLSCVYNLDEITIIDSCIDEDAPNNVNSGLWYLAKYIELLATTDLAIFVRGWENARGCRIEFECAKKYGLSYICETE